MTSRLVHAARAIRSPRLAAVVAMRRGNLFRTSLTAALLP